MRGLEFVIWDQAAGAAAEHGFTTEAEASARLAEAYSAETHQVRSRLVWVPATPEPMYRRSWWRAVIGWLRGEPDPGWVEVPDVDPVDTFEMAVITGPGGYQEMLTSPVDEPWPPTAACHVWPRTTPSGHVYEAPTTYAELREMHTTAAQAVIEQWAPAEHPPEPTWEILAAAHHEVEKLQRQLGIRA